MAFLTGAPLANAGPSSQTWTTPFPHKPGDKARDKDGNEYVFCSFLLAVAGSGVVVSITPTFEAAPLLGTSLLTGRVGVAGTTVAAAEGGWVQVYGLAAVMGGGDNSSTDASVAAANGGTSVSEADAGSVWFDPQKQVTSPSGTLSLYSVDSSDTNPWTSEVATLTSNTWHGQRNTIWGMYWLKPADVSALPDSYFTARFNNVTSPVSAVSNTTGPVTLTTRATSHLGGEYYVWLNYPYLMGNRTS